MHSGRSRLRHIIIRLNGTLKISLPSPCPEITTLLMSRTWNAHPTFNQTTDPPWREKRILWPTENLGKSRNDVRWVFLCLFGQLENRSRDFVQLSRVSFSASFSAPHKREQCPFFMIPISEHQVKTTTHCWQKFVSCRQRQWSFFPEGGAGGELVQRRKSGVCAISTWNQKTKVEFPSGKESFNFAIQLAVFGSG